MAYTTEVQRQLVVTSQLYVLSCIPMQMLPSTLCCSLHHKAVTLDALKFLYSTLAETIQVNYCTVVNSTI